MSVAEWRFGIELRTDRSDSDQVKHPAIRVLKTKFLHDFQAFGRLMHEAHTDFCVLLRLIFLLIVGSDTLSFDDPLSR